MTPAGRADRGAASGRAGHPDRSRVEARPARVVGLYLPNLLGGGAERVTLHLAEGLLDEGLEVDLVLATAAGPLLDSVPSRVEVVDLGAPRTLASLPALARYLRRRRPDAFLSALNHANIVAVWAARLARYRAPLVVAEHNDPAAGGRATRRERRFRVLMRRAYPYAHRVVAVSRGVKDGLVDWVGLAPDSVRVIYNPVLTPAVCAAMEERPAHPFFGAGRVVVGVGRLTRQKNFPNLLRAFARVRQRGDVRLILLGEGEERDALSRQVEALGLEEAVSMPGFVTNPYAYLATADLFVLSSDWEGLPTVLIEALAAGAAVVSTDCRSGPREILDGGRYGELVPVDDSEALAGAMLRALEKGRPAGVDRAWLEPFTLRFATSQYRSVLGLDGP